MLLLARKVGEKIAIDGGIFVTVVAIKGASVRLGVTAPAAVRVDRLEVHERCRGWRSRSPVLSGFSESKGDSSMQTAQPGDRVQVHYVKRLQNGSVASSRKRAPLEMTVGIDHPRLPGLGLALVGLAPGTSATVSVPSESAYGSSDPTRVHRWARTRFPNDQALPVGKWVRVLNRRGQPRLVRIVEVRGKTVVVDTNHRWAGQTMELEVQLIGIQVADAGAE